MRTEFSSDKEKHNYFNRMTHEQKLDAFGEILASCRHVAFLGGAGVSTESGIPDFRSKNGLYRKREKNFAKYKPEYLLSYDCLHKKPEVFFSYYRKNLDARRAQPNTAHYKLAELERAGKLEGVITQNIDGLHQKAGSRKVYEIHGSVRENYCMECNAPYPMEAILHSEGIPRCKDCGGVIRPNVTLYGEPLPKYVCIGAIREITNADTLIVAGTSLAVEPAYPQPAGSRISAPRTACMPGRKSGFPRRRS